MDFDLDQRTASLSIGEFAGFTIGPREPGDGGSQGIWRAQLGTHWHRELRATAAASTPEAAFEVTVTGRVFHAGWTLTLTGRIDQFLPATAAGPAIIREIKTTLDPLPAPEEDLRAAHPGYFAQLATYLALARIAPLTPAAPPLPGALPPPPAAPPRGELVFVEAGSGLLQTIAFTPADETPFRVQLERVAEFLNLRLRARERLRHLAFRPAFTALRAGQQTTRADLAAALAAHPRILFTAPTGFGKTGVLLECALGAMKSGLYSRLLYLTSKATGQLQVLRTLQAMTAPPQSHPITPPSAPQPPSSPSPHEPPKSICHLISDKPPTPLVEPDAPAATPVAAWHVRPKHEHCLDPVCFCQRREFTHPDTIARRWASHGLARFYLFENEARDLDALRAAGRDAQICPYEITRTALALQDVWIGDYNYVFAPANRGLFYNQPGFNPAGTLLVIDEAHNLPARAADARSHTVLADDARRVLAELDHVPAPAPLRRAWETWTLLLASLAPCDALDPAQEDDLADTLRHLADTLTLHPLSLDEIGQPIRELLWQIPDLTDWFTQPFPRLVWSPRSGELRLTCLDAALPTGETLRDYTGVIFATATPGPVAAFAEACGLMPPPSAEIPTSKSQITNTPSAAATGHSSLLTPHLAVVTAHTPWRDNAFDIAYDVRVDTTYRQRALHAATTAGTIAALHEASASAASSGSGLSALDSGLTATPCVAVFFPSYAYAEAIGRALQTAHPHLRVALQPRLSDLAAQTAWVDESLAFSDALFLVLGSSFAEGIDVLGGRVSHAMVVGPALPEVNPVQQARLAALAHLTREEAFRRVYQIPGMQKINQALGRLVRSPGQRAKVLLHCRRFVELSYARLLDRDYQFGETIATDADLAAWLG